MDRDSSDEWARGYREGKAEHEERVVREKEETARWVVGWMGAGVIAVSLLTALVIGSSRAHDAREKNVAAACAEANSVACAIAMSGVPK